MTEVLRLTEPSDYVLDMKGESIFRRRPIYYVLEAITRAHAVAMGRAALRASGIDQAEVERVDGEYRARDCERLELQSATGDLHAGLDRSFNADRALPEAEVTDPG